MSEQDIKDKCLGMATFLFVGALLLWITAVDSKRELKIEAVEHGYAHYVDGDWKWNHEQ